MAYRAWLLHIDPSDQWERRVQLGGRPAELTPAPLRFEEAGACEDLDLTARLKREFEELNSTSHRPSPPCLDCGSRKTFCAGRSTGFPRFQCLACKLRFTRRRGTPFVNTKASSFDRMRVFIRYLSLPLSIMQVSKEVGTSHEMIQKWRDMFAAFADQLQPSGGLSTQIWVGATPSLTTPCPFCGRTGTAQRTDGRGWSCTGCGRLFSMQRRVVGRDDQLHIADEAA